METLDVIIIGAGAAGIAAGCKLLENDVRNIVVLEAKDRIGGRIYSFEVDGSFLDLGGQWCHGQDNNVVYSLAKDLDLLSPSVNSYNEFKMYTPTLTVDKKVFDTVFDIAWSIEKDQDALKKDNGSFGDYFLNRFKTEIKQKFGFEQRELIEAFCDWYHKFVSCINACPTWFDLSAKGYTQYEACNGNYYLHFRNKGYKIILDVLMKKIPDPTQNLGLEDKIRLNKIVTSIKWNNSDGVIVYCSDRSSYKAKCVVVTTPLGALKKTQDNLFVPELPLYKVRAIRGLGFGTVNKIFLKFPSLWWSDDRKGINILWSEEDKKRVYEKLGVQEEKSWIEDIFGFYPLDSHDNILLVWVVGEHVSVVENLPDHVILHYLTTILQYFIGNKYKIPNPVGVLKSKWHSDPHCYGSYSYRSKQSEKLSVFANDLARPIYYNSKLVLLFAGEATSDRHYSTVHGAIDSGFREADRIIGAHRNLRKKSKL